MKRFAKPLSFAGLALAGVLTLVPAPAIAEAKPSFRNTDVPVTTVPELPQRTTTIRAFLFQLGLYRAKSSCRPCGPLQPDPRPATGAPVGSDPSSDGTDNKTLQND